MPVASEERRILRRPRLQISQVRRRPVRPSNGPRKLSQRPLTVARLRRVPQVACQTPTGRRKTLARSKVALVIIIVACLPNAPATLQAVIRLPLRAVCSSLRSALTDRRPSGTLSSP